MKAGLGSRIMGCLIIASIILPDISFAMQDEPEQQKQALLSTPLRVIPDQPSSTGNSSSSRSSDRDSPPRLLVEGSSSAPARLEGPPPSNNVVLLQQPRSASLPLLEQQDNASLPIAFRPISLSPENTEVLAQSPNIGRVSSADLRLVSIVDPRQALLKLQLSQPLLEQQDNPYLVDCKHLFKKTRNRSSATSQFLKCFKEEIVEGKLTKTQYVVGTGGWIAGIASGSASSAPFVYGVRYLTNAVMGEGSLANFVVYFTIITQGLDAMSRVGSRMLQWARPSREGFSMLVTQAHRCARFGAYVLISGGSVVLAMLPVKYLYDAEYKNMQAAEKEGQDTTSFKVFLYATAPGYLWNNFLINLYPRVDEALDDIDQHHYALQRKKNPLEERWRQEILGLCHDGERLVESLAALRVRQLYQGIYTHRLQKTSEIEADIENNNWHLKKDMVLTTGEYAKLKKKGLLTDNDKEISDELRARLALSETLTVTDQERTISGRRLTDEERSEYVEEEIRQAEALRVLLVLKAFHLAHKEDLTLEDLQQDKHNLAEKIATTIKALASSGKAYVFFWLIDNALGGGIISKLVAFFGGSFLANGVMGNTEKRRVKEFVFENILGGKVLQAHKSHPTLRKGTEYFSWLVGAFNTLPFFVLGLEATASWGNSIGSLLGKILMLAPYTIADIARNLGLIVDPYQGIVSLGDSVVSGCCPPEGYMRDKLKQNFRELGTTYRDASYEVVQNVHQMMQRTDLESGQPQSLSVSTPIVSMHSERRLLNENRKDNVEQKDDAEVRIVTLSDGLRAKSASVQLAYQASSESGLEEDNDNVSSSSCCTSLKASAIDRGWTMAILCVMCSLLFQLLEWVIL